MKITTTSTAARVYFGTLLLIIATGFLCAIPFTGTRAQMPNSGTIHSTDTATVKWTATTISPGGVVNDESKCVDGVNCETYTLTIAGAPADWKGKKVQVLLTWSSSTNEYDMYIHKGSNDGPLATPAA